MPHPNRLKLSLAGTAALALASLPLGVTPASAARVSQESTASIGVVVESSSAQQFNLGNLGAHGLSTVLVAQVWTNVGGGRKTLRALENTVINLYTWFLNRLPDWYQP